MRLITFLFSLLATASADTTIRVWKTIDFSMVAQLSLPDKQRWVWDCAFSEDSQYIISGKLIEILCPKDAKKRPDTTELKLNI